jgi:hypothetical protein
MSEAVPNPDYLKLSTPAAPGAAPAAASGGTTTDELTEHSLDGEPLITAVYTVSA